MAKTAKRKLAAHQKALREEYGREFRNLKKRVRRLERKGYEFSYKFEKLEKPTKKDIERIRKVRGVRLAKTGAKINRITGEVEVPAVQSAIRSIASITTPRTARPVQPTVPPPPPQPVPEEPEAFEPEEPDTLEPERVYHDDLPVWEQMAIGRLVETIDSYTHRVKDPAVGARAYALKELVDRAIRQHGAEKIANLVAQIMEDYPDILDKNTFYTSSGFSRSMEIFARTFRDAGAMGDDEYAAQAEAWERIEEVYGDATDYEV